MPSAGFENFDTKNEFEQLLINFTNESLQDTFNKQVFNNELKLYVEEGIDVVVSSCPDNTQCLLMLSSKPKGIIPRCGGSRCLRDGSVVDNRRACPPVWHDVDSLFV